MPNQRIIVGMVLGVLFLFALAMGAGPGVLLIDQTQFWFGLPRLYVWGVGWCAVEAVIITLAYFFVWPDDDESPLPHAEDGE